MNTLSRTNIGVIAVWVWGHAVTVPAQTTVEQEALPAGSLAVSREAAEALEQALDEAGVETEPSAPQAPPPAAQPPPQQSPPPPPVQLSRWYVEIASHPDRIDAALEADAFSYRSLDGLRAEALKNKEGQYTVAVGPFEEPAQAEAHLKRLGRDTIANQTPRLIEIK